MGGDAGAHVHAELVYRDGDQNEIVFRISKALFVTILALFESRE